MPHALAIGVPYDVFWRLNPKKLEAFTKAYKIRRGILDEEMWIMGQYVVSAVRTAVERCFAGRKAKAEYVKRPFFSEEMETAGMSQEEIDARELEKMIMYEEMWIRQHKKHGLEEVKIL